MSETKTRQLQRRRIVSMRLVFSLTAAALVMASVIGVGSVAERYLRRALTTEVQTRLMLEAQHLANLGSDALLDDFPELLLMPVVQQMQDDRPELAFVVLTDHEGLVQGHADSRRHGTQFELPKDLVPETSGAGQSNILQGDSELIVASVPIIRGEDELGVVHVGLWRSYLDDVVARSRRALVGVSAVMMVLAVTIASILMHVLLRPVTALRAGLERVGRGDLDTPMHLSDRTELGLLADTVNDMASQIRDSQQAMIEKERLDHEMDLARRIQASLMPDTGVKVGRFSGLGLFESAAEVGGDYFDVFELPEHQLGVFVADVAGKGLGGCLVTSMLAALVRTNRREFTSPRELLVRLDRDLAGFLEPGIFVTAFYGILDSRSGRFTFASAAHCPLLLARPSIGVVEEFTTEGVPLGILPHDVLEASLVDHSALLADGDLALIYTDGLTEAPRASDGEQYGVDRVKTVMRNGISRGSTEVLETLRREVSEWEGSDAHADDLTLLALCSDMSPETEVASIECTTDSTATGSLGRVFSEQDLAEATAAATALPVREFPVAVKDVEDWIAQGDALLVQAVYEYICNVQEHGFMAPRRPSLELWYWPSQLNHPLAGQVLIRDKGRPCPPDSVVSPDLEDSAVRMRGRGFGWEFMRRALENIDYRVIPKVGNLCLMKPRPPIKTRESVDV